MARRPVTKELYRDLLVAYRLDPGNATAAARLAGCDQRMAARGWRQGWVNRLDWALPICDVIEAEKAAKDRAELVIVAKANKEAEAIVTAAAIRSAEAAQRESDSQVELSKIVLTMNKSIGKMLPGLERLCEVVNMRLEQAADEPASVDIVEAVGLIGEMTKNGERMAKMHAVVMESQRLALNQPQRIVGYADLSGITAAEAAAESRRLVAEFAEAEARELRGGIEGVLENADGTAIVLKNRSR